jgi:hypothetical protein
MGLLGVINSVNPQLALNAANTGTQVRNIGNIDRSVAGNEFWRSPVLSNGGINRALTEDLWLQAEDQVREKGGAKLTNWFMNLAIGRRYHEIIRADTFFTMGRAELARRRPRPQGKGGEAAGPDGTAARPEFSGVRSISIRSSRQPVVGFDRSHFLGVGENETRDQRHLRQRPFFRQTNNASFRWRTGGAIADGFPPAGARSKTSREA